MAWQVCNKILHEFPARFARYDFFKAKRSTKPVQKGLQQLKTVHETTQTEQ